MNELSSPVGNPLQIILEHGGIAAYFILFSAIALVIITLERFGALFVRYSFNTTQSLERMHDFIVEKRYTEALQVCNSQPQAPALLVQKSGLMAVENGREAMKHSISEAVLAVSQKCEKRIGYISLIANVATLLGLFGTILGLIKTFGAIAKADPAQKGALLGQGISEAMYCTAAGLFVGITAMVIHTIFVSKVDTIVGSAQDAGLKLMSWVEQSERSAHAKRTL